jgi:hypothetical protein
MGPLDIDESGVEIEVAAVADSDLSAAVGSFISNYTTGSARDDLSSFESILIVVGSS